MAFTGLWLLLLMKDATIDPSVILLQASATGSPGSLLQLILVGFEAFTTVCDTTACQVFIPADELLIKVGRILFFLLPLSWTAAIGALLPTSASLPWLSSCTSRA